MVVANCGKGTAYLDFDEDDMQNREVAATETLSLQLSSLEALKSLQEECPEIKKISEISRK